MMLHICYALIWGQPLSKNKEIHHSGNTVDGFLFCCFFLLFVWVFWFFLRFANTSYNGKKFALTPSYFLLNTIE